MLEPRMPQQTFRVEGFVGLHRDPVAGLIQCPRRRRSNRRQAQIALLFEQRRAEAHGVGAAENNGVEGGERTQLRGDFTPAAERFDVDGRQPQGVRAFGLQQPAQRHRLLLGPSDQDADTVQGRHGAL